MLEDHLGYIFFGMREVTIEGPSRTSSLPPVMSKESSARSGQKLHLYTLRKMTLHQRAGATSVYRFHIPNLPEDLQKRGMILKLLVNDEIASRDLKDRILRCSRGLGASIYIGLPQGPSKTLLIGIDPSISPRCVFDDTPASVFHNLDVVPKNGLQLTQTVLEYQSQDPRTPGPHQKRYNNLSAEFIRPDEQSATAYLKQAIKVEETRDWDQWLSSERATSALLELEIYTSVEKTGYFQTRLKRS